MKKPTEFAMQVADEYITFQDMADTNDGDAGLYLMSDYHGNKKMGVLAELMADAGMGPDASDPELVQAFLDDLGWKSDDE